MRKAVQLIDSEGYICALCDDGTIWVLSGGQWQRMEPIPQDALPDNDAKERT